ncbi:MAG: DUF2336 domain-containing protein [Proteobacteria bacterium]|nr:DUF2336 domain-containing protein [Pseudomonadota bacterium]
MTDAKQRLTHLVELATTNAPENRRALAVELCDLLLDWPAHYPVAMREPFEALLEKIVHMIDAGTRRALAEKLGARTETPLPLLNEFYFDAPAETRDAIVLRNALMEDGTQPHIPGADEKAIVAAARNTENGAFTASFAKMLGIETVTAERILHDHSGRALAIACKGAHLTRATFSAIVLITEGGSSVADTRERLSSFDSVPLTGAERLLDYWRTKYAA